MCRYESSVVNANAVPSSNTVHVGVVKSTHYSTIPIKRLKTASQVSYVSAIALKEAKRFSVDPQFLANEIIQAINLAGNLNIDAWIQDLNDEMHFTVSSPGWIGLKISEKGLIHWLKQVFDGCKKLDYAKKKKFANSIHQRDQDTPKETEKFMLASKPDQERDIIMLGQYAYARCCGWLGIFEKPELMVKDLAYQLNEFQSDRSDLENFWTECQFILVDTIDELNAMQSNMAEQNELYQFRLSKPGNEFPELHQRLRQQSITSIDQLARYALAVQAKYAVLRMEHHHLQKVNQSSIVFNCCWTTIVVIQECIRFFLEEILHESTPRYL